MIKKTLIALGIAAPLILSQQVSARDLGSIFTDCGLGAMLAAGAKEESTGDILAIVTNVTWDLGTTAVSSDATTPDSCARGKAEVAMFIHESYDAIEKDLASGHGEYLSTLKKLNESGEGFEESLRTAFAQQVADASYTQKSRFEKSDMLFGLVNQIN